MSAGRGRKIEGVMEAAALWRTRVTWALVGAGVTLAIMSGRERGAPEASEVEPVAAVQPVQPVVVAQREASDEAMPVVAPPPEPLAEPARPLTHDAVASEAVASAGAAASTTPTPTPAAPTEDFEIPLPMMPGTRVMKRGQQPDEEHGGMIHTLALSVPAAGFQVEGFYRSALANAKLTVTGGGGEPSSLGSGHRSSLRGRGREASVHVNLQQPAGRLRTVVRIIWRRLQ